MAVGTPNRVQKLVDAEALGLDRLRLVLIDMQPDVKKRTVLDIPEVRCVNPLLALFRACWVTL